MRMNTGIWSRKDHMSTPHRRAIDRTCRAAPAWNSHPIEHRSSLAAAAGWARAVQVPLVVPTRGPHGTIGGCKFELVNIMSNDEEEP